ncbi:helix-hairpin-helix domain-containing protein [Erythrobacter sp. EC-HK427]|uniref:helix-hairpin-helix domain-containing protein n=1 Tax=Erythrobacter sp. EC-HK427 TaxID=2038396 RepID=UPI001256DA28|nr:helix-hairpin-helix domain-containing protein [Erythrobacter sp. EC-HK427]VVT11499.1 conserved hypothetical protein [Erythrobacter sp. EC-HK427]
MPELLAEYWYLVLAAFVLGLVIAWWIFSANRKTRVEIEDKPDATGGAKRNQALIDAPAAVAKDAPSSSPGPLSATANSDAVAAAPAAADAEAGAAVPAREAIREMAAAPTAQAGSEGDDLRRIKGVGPKLVTLLAEQGVTSFAQIAAWSDADIDRIDATLGRFEGRIRRDDWVAQAQLLAADDLAGYEARFGKL